MVPKSVRGSLFEVQLATSGLETLTNSRERFSFHDLRPIKGFALICSLVSSSCQSNVLAALGSTLQNEPHL